MNRTFTAALLAMAATVAAASVDRHGDPLPAGAIQRLGTLRFVYPAGIGDLGYLRDGTAVIAVGATLEFWDMAAGERRRTVELPAAVTSLERAAASDTLLLATAAGTLIELDPAAGRIIRQVDAGGRSIARAAYSPDGSRALATVSAPPVVSEWELATGIRTAEIPIDLHSVREAVYNPDGRRFYAHGANGSGPVLAEHALPGGELVKAWHTDYYTHARSIALAPDGERLLIGSRTSGSEWLLGTHKQVRRFTGHHGHAVTAVAYCPDPGQLLTGSRDGSIRRWNRVQGEVLLRWQPHNRYVTHIRVSPDGRWVLSYGSNTVNECSLETGRPRLQWDRHQNSVQAVAFLDNLVASASADDSIRLWDPLGGNCHRTIAAGAKGLYSLAAAATGERLAAGGKDGTIREFSTGDGRARRTLSGHRGYVRSLVYGPDGRLYSSADDGTIRVWEETGDEARAVFQGHRGGVLGLALSADGRFLASGGRDGTVRLWNTRTATPLWVQPSHDSWVTSLAFAEDGSVLSVGTDGRLQVSRGDDGEAVSRIAVGPGAGQPATPLAAVLSLGDGQAAVALGDGSIHVWSVAARRLVSRHPGHSQAVNALAAAPNGRVVVSGSTDGTLLVWDRDSLRETQAAAETP